MSLLVNLRHVLLAKKWVFMLRSSLRFVLEDALADQI